MLKKLIFFGAYAPIFLISRSQSAPPEKIPSVRFAQTITADELKHKLYIITGEEFAGRETGEQGQKLCAVYLAEHFKSLGLPPVITRENQPLDSTVKSRGWMPHTSLSGYMQSFPLTEERSAVYTLTMGGKNYEFMKDYFAFQGIPDNKYSSASAVFVGFGIDDPKYGLHEYEGLDVRGKVVVFFEDEPMDKEGNSLVTGSRKLSEWTTDLKLKTEAAKNAGAIAILSVQKHIEQDINSYRHYLEKPKTYPENKYSKQAFPKFYISERMADDLFRLAGKKVNTQTLREQYRTGERKRGFELIVPIEISVKTQVRTISGENILGFIEGTDLKDEIIVLTAHYDHLGKDETGIYYGADDNGSGTAALMEIAEAFAEAKKAGFGPRRSILIMPVSGEEKGLLGSEYYSENPVFSIEKTIANLNIDMIGRTDDKHRGNSDYVYVIGADRISPDLHRINEEVNERYSGLELDYTFNDPRDPNRYYYRSDHYNFARKGIPSVFFFSGIHEDYHRVSDTPDKIMYDKLAKITRHIFHLAWELANSPDGLTKTPKEKGR